MNHQEIRHCRNCGWIAETGSIVLLACPSCHGRLKDCDHGRQDNKEIEVRMISGRTADKNFLKI